MTTDSAQRAGVGIVAASVTFTAPGEDSDGGEAAAALPDNYHLNNIGVCPDTTYQELKDVVVADACSKRRKLPEMFEIVPIGEEGKACPALSDKIGDKTMFVILPKDMAGCRRAHADKT